jgi:hypothetical protein
MALPPERGPEATAYLSGIVSRTSRLEALAEPPAIVGFVIYLIAGLVLFGEPLFHRHQCICLGTDEGIFVWAFAWWPHALLHGSNPFHSGIIYAPQGFNIALGALVPGAALLFSPVTAIAGPLFAYNLAMLLCPALGAFFAFLLCRRLTGRFWPSLFGGWCFGFSTYMFGQLLGHMQMTLVFLVPAIVHLVLRGLAGELGRRRLFGLLLVALVLQFAFSPEVFVSFTLFGAIALAIGFVFADPRLRAGVRGVIVPILGAYGAAAIIVSPYLYYAFQPGGLPILVRRTEMFSNDLLGLVVPTQVTKLGGTHFLSTSSRFTAGIVEGGAYLGLPLIAMICLGARRRWRDVGGKVMIVTLLVVLVCSFGARLHVDGATSIPLPWAIGSHLPVLGLALPSRFAMYAFLIGGMLAATWLADARTRVAPWLLAAVSVACIWPAIGLGLWRGSPPLPSLFTSSRYRAVITPSDTALLLPVGISGYSMLWQAESGLRFKMASGYVVPPEAPDPYKVDPAYPTLTAGIRVSDVEGAAASFLYTHHVTVAVVDPGSAQATPWISILQRLGWRARTIGGTVVLRPA